VSAAPSTPTCAATQTGVPTIAGVPTTFGAPLRGVKWGDQVILNPPVNLVEGSKVQSRPDAAASNG
jgi:hypothetical protein